MPYKWILSASLKLISRLYSRRIYDFDSDIMLVLAPIHVIACYRFLAFAPNLVIFINLSRRDEMDMKISDISP